MAEFIISIDQGTTSSRAILFSLKALESILTVRIFSATPTT